MKPVQAAALIGFSAALLCGAGGRRKIWDLDLSKFVAGQQDMAELVWGIRFSPDESKLAVGFGPSWNFDARPRHVAVVDVDKPHILLRNFEVAFTSFPLTSGPSIAWSPSGTMLVVKSVPPVMLRLGGEAPCSFDDESEFGGFLAEDRMVLYRRFQAEIKVLRADCTVYDRWQIDGPADVLDTSPERGLLAIDNHAQSAIELVDAQNHKISQHWTSKAMESFRGGFLFADRGKAVCSAFLPEDSKRPDAACWNTQTGEKLAEHDKVGVDHGAIESAGGELLAITDYKYISHQGPIWVFLDLNNDYTVPRRQLIWNFRTGKEIASWGDWGVDEQKELWGRDLKNASKIRSRYVLSLSPTGQYLAEAGSGSMLLYAIKP